MPCTPLLGQKRNPIKKCGECFVVTDTAGQKLAYVYL
jgi:hypothetical protein